MPGLNDLRDWLILPALSLPAYAGPGVGLDFLQNALYLVLWVLTMFTAVLLWPVYALLRRLRGGKKKSAAKEEKNTETS
jgi:hypothetical protein